MGVLLDRLGVELPIVQAGMGGGLSRHQLAVAVSAAGGLGTIGMLDPEPLRTEITEARAMLGRERPIAVNLLLPFARPAHFDAAAEADVVVTFWGKPVRRTEGLWIHQCGSVNEALAALVAGADAVIAQGVESGGHVRGTAPAAELLERMRGALPDGYPVLSAGGVAGPADVVGRMEAGAEAVVCGTRFVMTDESSAHPGYKARLLEARETVLTELFGLGWPVPHRVVPNEAAARWLRAGTRPPFWLRAANRAATPLVAHGPVSSQFRLLGRLASTQRAGFPMLSPAAPVAGGPGTLLEAGPLYAGESVSRIDDIRPAGEVVRALAG